MSMLDSQRYSENLYLLNYKEDNVVFPGLNLINSDNFSVFFCYENTQVTKKPHLKIFNFPNLYMKIKLTLHHRKLLIQALLSLHEGLLQISITVPLKGFTLQY